jgi:hypothetical protein
MRIDRALQQEGAVENGDTPVEQLRPVGSLGKFRPADEYRLGVLMSRKGADLRNESNGCERSQVK